jgi:hypothetical protein
MDKRTSYTFGYPASLTIANVSKDTPSHDVGSIVADAFGVACIFAALVLFLMVTK